MDNYNADIALLKQEFQNYQKIVDKEINALERITQEQEKRITQLEKNNTKTDLQYDQIIKILNKLTEETIPNLTAQVEELKNKPAKRYEQVISGILGAIAGAIGGIIAGLFMKN